MFRFGNIVRSLLTVGCCVCFCLPVLVRAQKVDQSQVDQLASAIVRAVSARQADDGSFLYARPSPFFVGSTALVLYSFSCAGMPASDPVIVRGLQFLRTHDSLSTYEEGLVLLAMQQIDSSDPANRKRMTGAVERLVSWQGVDGGWGYGADRSRSDESCSQYAVLGLTAAVKAKLAVPAKVLESARMFYLKMQNPDGGWGYVHQNSTFSMTCAGVASLTLLGVKLEQPVMDHCGTYKYNRQLANGVKWLDAHFREFMRNIRDQSYCYYALYGLERVGILNGLKAIGGRDWYRDGCADILSHQNWTDSVVNCAFALLFIARNAAPYAICKWQWSGDWNPDHADVKNWVETASSVLKQPLDWQSASLSDGLGQAGRSSMLFVSGHGEFRVSDAELKHLNQFLQSGGMLVADPCCGDRRFRDSFIHTMENRLSPGKKLQFRKLSPTHPVYRGIYNIDPRDVPIRTIRQGCSQKRVFLLEHDLSCLLNHDVRVTPAERELANRLAVNLLACSLGRRKAFGKFETASFSEPGLMEELLSASVVKGDGVVYQFDDPVGRVMFKGEWDTDPGFVSGFSKLLASYPRVPRFDAQTAVNPESDDIFGCRLLLLSGHDAVSLSEKAVLNLRAYLRNGGRILIEACCADKQFVRSIPQLCRQLFPASPLQRIPLSDRVYHAPFELAGKPLAVSSGWKKTFGDDRLHEISGVRSLDGGWDLLFVPFDIGCSAEGDLEGDSTALKLPDSAGFYANLMMALFPEPKEENTP